MRKLKMLLLALFLTLSLGSLNAQTFDWCEGVTSNGKPIGSYTTFTCDYASCFVYGLFALPYISNDDYVIYDIYRYDSRGNETYYDTYTYYTAGQNWNWIYQKITFKYSGTYICYIYTKYTKNSTSVYQGKSLIKFIF